TQVDPDPSSPLTLNANGTISIAANTPAGTYELEYRICENLNSGNCSTAIATVTVEAAPIIANPDDFDSINGRIGGITASVLINDTLNGAIVNPADVTLSLVDGDSELTLNPDGTIGIAPNTQAGTYELEYRICENLNPSNCSTAIATVTVEAAPILANPDDFDSINGRTGGTTASVLINDTLNGAIVNPADVTLSLVDGDSELTLNANGTIGIAPNTPAGTYELEYRICENLNPSNCSTAIATVTVEAAPILANPDDFDSINGRIGGTTASVLINDTLNGAIVNPTDVTLSLVDGDSELTLNANGTISVSPNTQAGTYELEYRICENLNSGNCSTAIARVSVVTLAIEINNNDLGIHTTDFGGDLGNILDNDRLNGLPIDPELVEIDIFEMGGLRGLVVSSDGSLFLLPGLNEPGTYLLQYRVCELLNPTNCGTAFISITLEAPRVNLSITKTSNEIKIWEGDVFEYVIRVQNIGTSNANNVTIEDNLPNDLSFVSETIESSFAGLEVNFIRQENRLIWNISILPMDNELEIKLQVRANTLNNSSIEQFITNTVLVSSAEQDIDLSNNVDTDVNKINPFVIPNVITPDNDGKNDRFVINGLGKFVSNRIVIFNRYGDHVYESTNYQNDWSADGLPNGTFYYVFNAMDSEGKNHEFKGWILVKK
ncbi:gliding motility-associated C-terminal domain-containing protein, partial [Belliella kenyensis]